MTLIAADLMQRNPEIAYVEHSCFEAAARMRDSDVGILFVADGDELVGTLTDRDIVVRVIAAGRRPEEVPVIEAMTKHIVSVPERTRIEAVAEVMARERLRRLAVLNDRNELVGLLSLSHLEAAAGGAKRSVHEALKAVSSAGHSSRPHRADPAGGRAKGLKPGPGEVYGLLPRKKRGGTKKIVT